MTVSAWTPVQLATVRTQADMWGAESEHVWSNAAMLAAIAALDEAMAMLRSPCRTCAERHDKPIRRYGANGFAHVNDDGSLFADCRLSYDQQHFLADRP